MVARGTTGIIRAVLERVTAGKVLAGAKESDGMKCLCREQREWHSRGDLIGLKRGMGMKWLDELKTRCFGKRHKAQEEYITDQNGNLYTEKPVLSKLGIPVGNMVFRVSDREPVPLLVETVFGGFLGVHRFAVGEIGKGIGYAISAGGFGIFVLMDILEILGGRFSYLETAYEEKDGEIQRNQERLYVRRPEMSLVWKAGAVFLGTGISMLLFFTAYKIGYRHLFELLGNVTSQAVKGILE